MRFHLQSPIVVDRPTQHEELARLVAHAGALAVRCIVTGQPATRVLQRALVLEAPDALEGVITQRVLPRLLGEQGAWAVLARPVPDRPEWTHHVLLLPTPAAAPLDLRVLEGWASASLTCHYAGGMAGAILQASAADVSRLPALRALGWRAIPLPRPLRRPARLVRLPYRGAIALQDPGAPVWQVSAGGAGAARPAGGAPGAVPASEAALLAPGAPVTPRLTAAPGAEGMDLGVTLDGTAVRLAWKAQTVAVEAAPAVRAAVARTLIARALQHAVGLVAVVPPEVIAGGYLGDLADRLRVLDGRERRQSAAIPWQRIDYGALRDALATAGLQQPLPRQRPEHFGALLAQVGGDALCTAPVLALTAIPGDDLAGVVAAGGGVMLVDSGDDATALLGALLASAVGAPAGRAVLVVRPPSLAIPPALARQAIQVVLGAAPDALLTLRDTGAAWELRADGRLLETLDRDLDRPALDVAADVTAQLVERLGERAEGVAPAAGGDWEALAAPTQETADLGSLERLMDADPAALAAMIDAARVLGAAGADPAAAAPDDAEPSAPVDEARVARWVRRLTADPATALVWSMELELEPEALPERLALLGADADDLAYAADADWQQATIADLRAALSAPEDEAPEGAAGVSEAPVVEKVLAGATAAPPRVRRGRPPFRAGRTHRRTTEAPADGETRALVAAAAAAPAPALAPRGAPEPLAAADEAPAPLALPELEALAAESPLPPVAPEADPEPPVVSALAPTITERGEVVLDAVALRAAWAQGVSLSDLVAEVARVYPQASRPALRADIRALVTAAGPAAPPPVSAASPLPSAPIAGAASLAPPLSADPLPTVVPAPSGLQPGAAAAAGPAGLSFFTAPLVAAPPDAAPLPSESDTVTTTEAAALLGYSDGYVRSLIHDGSLAATRNALGSYRIRREEVARYKAVVARRAVAEAA